MYPCGSSFVRFERPGYLNSKVDRCPQLTAARLMLYSLVHIYETSPYEVFAYKEDSVYFITDDGSEYLVGFIEETNIGIQRAYQLFIIKKRNGLHNGTDVKIVRTVSSIVHSFFRNPSNILVYICDTSDKDQAARDRKFKIWFKRYASLDDLVFVSEVIDVEDDSYFASMILSRRTTDFYLILTTFHDYFHDLRSKLE